MELYTLTITIFSTRHDSKGNPIPYALAGEQVRIISYHEDIMIVESMAGIRFSVKAENIKAE